MTAQATTTNDKRKRVVARLLSAVDRTLKAAEEVKRAREELTQLSQQGAAKDDQ